MVVVENGGITYKFPTFDLTTAPPTTLRESAAMSGALCRRREDEYETGTAPPTGTDVKLERAFFILCRTLVGTSSDGKPSERGVTSDPVPAVSEPNRAISSVPPPSSAPAEWHAAHHAAVEAQCPDPRGLVSGLQE